MNMFVFLLLNVSERVFYMGQVNYICFNSFVFGIFSWFFLFLLSSLDRFSQSYYLGHSFTRQPIRSVVFQLVKIWMKLLYILQPMCIGLITRLKTRLLDRRLANLQRKGEITRQSNRLAFGPLKYNLLRKGKLSHEYNGWMLGIRKRSIWVFDFSTFAYPISL